MKTVRMNIWEEGEYRWPQAYGFVPFLVGYLHETKPENGQDRPCMLVVPGGAYYIVSPTEGSIVADGFYEKGYNTFVLTYTTNLLGEIPLKDQPMKDLSRALRLIRSQAEAFEIDPKRVAVCGFSAGGHLVASEGVHYTDLEETNPAYAQYSNRPDALVLSYPVIDSGKYAHVGSIRNLLGHYYEEGAEQAWEEQAEAARPYLPGCKDAKEELAYMALHRHVTGATPPTFVWQTAPDEAVPVQNSYLFAQACLEAGVPFAHHVFSQGPHGLSVATERWENGRYGELYPLEPFGALTKAIREGKAPMPLNPDGSANLEKLEALEREYPNHAPGNPYGRQANSEIAVWPELVDQWLQTVWKN